MLTTLLLFYVGLNLFISGYQFNDVLSSYDNKNWGWIAIFILICLLFGAILYLYHFIEWLISDVIWGNFLNGTFQLGFLWKFYTSDKFRNVDKYKLLRFCNLSRNYYNTNSLKHRIFRHCTNLVMAANNYLYINNSPYGGDLKEVKLVLGKAYLYFQEQLIDVMSIEDFNKLKSPEDAFTEDKIPDYLKQKEE